MVFLSLYFPKPFLVEKVCLPRDIFLLKSLSMKDLGQRSYECESVCLIRSQFSCERGFRKRKHKIHARVSRSELTPEGFLSPFLKLGEMLWFA